MCKTAYDCDLLIMSFAVLTSEGEFGVIVAQFVHEARELGHFQEKSMRTWQQVLYSAEQSIRYPL